MHKFHYTLTFFPQNPIDASQNEANCVLGWVGSGWMFHFHLYRDWGHPPEPKKKKFQKSRYAKHLIRFHHLLFPAGGLFHPDDDHQEIAFRYAVEKINSDRTILPRSKLLAQIERISPQDSFLASKRGENSAAKSNYNPHTHTYRDEQHGLIGDGFNFHVSVLVLFFLRRQCAICCELEWRPSLGHSRHTPPATSRASAIPWR